jgi:hypothetical protein
MPESHQTAGQSRSDLQLLRRRQLTDLIPDATLVEIMLQWQLEEKKRRQGCLNRADKEAGKDNYGGSTANEWTVWREEDNGRKFVVMQRLLMRKPKLWSQRSKRGAISSFIGSGAKGAIS